MSQLTSDGIKYLMEEASTGEGQNLTFQILSSQRLLPKNNEQDKYKVELSDGHAKAYMIFGSSACQDFQTNTVKSLDVIKVTNILKNIQGSHNKIMIIVLNYQPVCIGQLKQTIGEPLDFEQYKQQGYINPKGSIIIPKISNQDMQVLNKGPLSANTSSGLAAKNQQQKSNFQQNANKGSSSIQYIDTSKSIQLSDDSFIPINFLHGQMDDFRIRARITKKTNIKEFSTQRGQGKLFSIDLLDKDGGQIQGKFWNDAVDKFYEHLQEGCIYIFQHGQIKMENSKYNSLNDYTITFDVKSQIEQIEDDSQIAQNKFNFIKIKDIIQKQKGDQFDLVAFVWEYDEEPTMMNLKSGEKKQKRDMTLVDDSLHTIKFTLWGDEANVPRSPGDVVVIKSLKFDMYNDIPQVKWGYDSKFITDDKDIGNIPEVQAIQQWEQTVSFSNDDLIHISKMTVNKEKATQYRAIIQIEQDGERYSSEQIRIFSDTIACVDMINEKQTFYYQSCTNNNCLKKVIKNDFNENYSCQSCQISNIKEPKLRYIFNIRIKDSTGHLYASVNDECGQKILGRSAQEFKNVIVDNNQDNLLLNELKSHQFTSFRFRIMTKQDTYNGVSKVKHQILKVDDCPGESLVKQNQLLIDLVSLYITNEQ